MTNEYEAAALAIERCLVLDPTSHVTFWRCQLDDTLSGVAEVQPHMVEAVNTDRELNSLIPFWGADSHSFERAFRYKVSEVFGLSTGVARDEAGTLYICTTLGADEAFTRLNEIEGWVMREYPDNTTVFGVLHVKGVQDP